MNMRLWAVGGRERAPEKWIALRLRVSRTATAAVSLDRVLLANTATTAQQCVSFTKRKPFCQEMVPGPIEDKVGVRGMLEKNAEAVGVLRAVLRMCHRSPRRERTRPWTGPQGTTPL